MMWTLGQEKTQKEVEDSRNGFEKKLAEIIKIEISNLNQDEEFVIKVEVVTDEKDKSGID